MRESNGLVRLVYLGAVITLSDESMSVTVTLGLPKIRNAAVNKPEKDTMEGRKNNKQT